jgi:glutamyl-tRNA synthetase
MTALSAVQPHQSHERGRYRGRIAPSPSGLLHLGHARTFWIAYQRALAANGTLILRNEDLDPQRSKPEFAAAMIEDLHWLGIDWQEGPGVPGKESSGTYGPYAQSQRYAIYLAAWERLHGVGLIYPCTCSRRELAQAAQAPHEDAPHEEAAHEHDDEPLYPGTCRPAFHSIAAATSPAGVNWRFRVPDGEAITFIDANLGPHTYIASRDFGDFLIWRRDDVPAYQLAVVVDDAAMGVTEVVRGADLLKSTARQMLLNRALGYSDPNWFHCELLRDEQGHRLAKRHDALSIRALRECGLQPGDVLRMAGL